MGTDSTPRRPGVGLALSGGGFRATLFHLGVLRRLLETGVLPKITHFSSVSGGSITSGAIAHDLATHPESTWEARLERIEALLREFCSKTVDTGTIVGGVLNPFRRVSDLLAKKYRKALFGELRMSELPATPEFTFCSTNLQSGRLLHITRKGVVDYRIGRNPVDVELATAVAASSAFPPFLSPVVVDTSKTPWTPIPNLSSLTANPAFTNKLRLTDGGAYDNMGLEPVWDDYETVLVSDAGAPYVSEEEIDTDWFSQLHCAFEIATDQARGVRKRWLIDLMRQKRVKGAYWGIASKVASFDLAGAIDAIKEDESNALSRMRTRLDAFNEKEQAQLIDWGYVICDTALRRWCGDLLVSAAIAPTLPGSGRVIS